MAWFTRDGVRLHYQATGNGPVVVFTHGFAASSHMFAAQHAALSTDYHVASWDMRGHGRSDSPNEVDLYSAAHSVADIAALLDVLGAERAVIAGHSLGGYLSLEFLHSHPERVAGLVLIDTGPGYRNDEARDQWNRMAVRFAEGFEQRGLEAMATSDELAGVEHRDARGLALTARHVLTQRDATMLASLPTIGVPTLVVVGECDTPFLSGSAYMASKIPGARLVTIAGARHGPTVTHPDAFNAALTTFLQSVSFNHPSGG